MLGAAMTDEEFRAIVAQGPAVVMVERSHMIALLDERDGLKAEVEFLREAARHLLDCCCWPSYRAAVDAARAVLAGEVKP